jgi:hypothetical protein
MGSTSSTIHVSGLRRQTIATLKSHAQAEGLSVARYVKDLIETDMSIAEMARNKTIDEIFAPVQKQFRESGMSEEELDRLVDQARAEHHRMSSRKK